MSENRAEQRRRTLLLAFLGTLVLTGAGVAVSQRLAESFVVGGALLVGAVGVAAVSPAAGISAVLLSLPSIHHLFPMPLGEFTLLELAILVAVAGTALNVGVRMFRGGAGDLASLIVPAQVVVPVMVLILATVVALLTLADPTYRTESLREVRTVIIEPLLFLGAARIVLRNAVARWWTAGIFVVAGTVMSAYAVAQVTQGWGGVAAGTVLRATGSYTHPNNLALFLERTLLFTAATLVIRPRWWPVWLLALVQMGGLILTYSRGAFIALATGFALILLLRELYKALLALIAGGVVIGGVAFAAVPDRLIDAGGSGSEPTRFTIWRSSLRMAADHPIFGVGPDQFLYQYWRRYVEPMGWPERYTSHPHNLVLDFWLRLGVLGLAAAGTLVVGITWLVRRSIFTIRNDVIGMGAVAALAGGVAHGMLDNGFFLPDLATMTWFFVACIVTMPYDRQRPMEEELAVAEPVTTTRQVSTLGVHAKHWIVLGATVAALAIFSAPQHALATTMLIGLGAVVAWFMPQAMIGVVLLSIPFQDAILLPFIRGDFTLTQIALFGLFIGWGVGFWRYRIWLDSILMWSLGIIAALMISLIETDRIGLWFGETYRWVVAIAFFVICRSVLRDWQAVRVVIWTIVIAVCGISAYSLGQLFSTDENINWVVGGVLRIYGTFGTPNPLAAYIEFTVPLFIVLSLLGLRRSFREIIGKPLWVALMVSSLLGVTVLGFTQSRGGWVGFAAAMGVVLLVLPWRVKIAGAIAGTALIGAFLLTPAGQSQAERFVNIFDQSESPTGSSYDYGTGRSSLWGAAIRMFEDKPLTGVGAGEFDHHYREYTPVWYDRFPRGQAHNGWLQMAAQSGVAGVLMFTGWIAATLVSLVGAARRSIDPLSRALAYGALSIMVAFTVHSLVDYLNVLSLGLQLGAIIAIGLNLSPDPLTAYARKPESATDSLRTSQQMSYA